MQVTAEQVLAMEDARYAAMIDGDLAALERMSADDLAYTHSSAVMDDKASYMAAMRAGMFSYRRIERPEAGGAARRRSACQHASGSTSCSRPVQGSSPTDS